MGGLATGGEPCPGSPVLPSPTWAFSIRRPGPWPLVPSELCPLPALRMLPTLPSLPTLFRSPAVGPSSPGSAPQWPTADWRPAPCPAPGPAGRGTWAVGTEPPTLQRVISCGLGRPWEAGAKRGGCRREAGHGEAHPLADHLHDARREVAHSVCASLALVDVALPAAVGVLLQDLRLGGTRGVLSILSRDPLHLCIHSHRQRIPGPLGLEQTLDRMVTNWHPLVTHFFNPPFGCI